MFETPPDKPSRPRKRKDCRAWNILRISQNGQKEAVLKALPILGPGLQRRLVRLPSRQLCQTNRETKSAGRNSRRQASTVVEKRSARAGAHDEYSRVWYITTEHVRISTSHVSSTNSEFISTRRVHQAQMLYIAPIPGDVYGLRENREFSSASENTKDKKSTTKAAGTRCLKVLDNKLRSSRVSRDATSDDKLADLQSVVETQLLERPLRDTEDFQSALRDLLQLTAVHIYECP